MTVYDSKYNTLFNQYYWYRNPHGYTAGRKKGDKSRKIILMHRLVLGVTDPKILVDHINGDKSDNRESNLRLVNPSQNGMNARSKGGKSKYKGVSWNRGRWQVYITHYGETISGGRYDCEIEAAKAYNELAKLYHKEFAYLNEVNV